MYTEIFNLEGVSDANALDKMIMDKMDEIDARTIISEGWEINGYRVVYGL